MKIRWMVFFLLAVTLTPLHAVGSKLQDGTYKVAFDAPDAFGYKEFVEITVVGGRIDSAVYDALNTADGTLKSEEPGYESQMKSAVGVGPKEYMKQLVKELLDQQSAHVDSVAGATESSANFRLLADEAIKKAIAGDTSEGTLPQPNPKS